MSKLRDNLEVDPPVTLNANYRLDHVELSKIDDKIRACEEQLVGSLLRGSVSTNFKIFQNTVNLALLKPGACVCLSGASDVLIDAATDVTLAASAQRIIGVLASPGVLGSFMTVVIDGVIPAGLAGVGTGSPGKVYVNGTTARLTRTETSYPVGTCDAAGNVQLGGASSSSSTSSTAHYLVSQPDASLPNAHEIRSTASIEAIASVDIVEWNCIFGETSGTVCQGDDSRLSDARVASGIKTATTTVSCSSATAPTPGQCLVATSSTAATWQSVCLTSDVHLNPTASELKTGQLVGASGTAIAFTGRQRNWWNCGVTPTANPTSSSSVTVVGLSVKPGDPVRILHKSSFIYAAGGTPSLVSTTITAIKGSILDYRGRLYFKTVQVSGVTFRLDIYSDEACTIQVGYTNSFAANVTGTNYGIPITAVNGSDLAGAVTCQTAAESMTAGLVHSACFMSTGICTSYTSNVLSFAGQTIGAVPGDVLEVWLGSPTLVVNWPIDLGGYYATADAADAFITRRFKKEFWDLPNGTLVQVKGSNLTNDTGATQAKIAAVVGGNQLVADGSALALSTSRVSTVVEMTPTFQTISYGNQLGLRVLKGTNGNSSDLEGHFVVVLD